MRNFIIIITLLIAVFSRSTESVITGSSDTGYKIQIFPEDVFPGDVFAIKSSTKFHPIFYFQDRMLHSHKKDDYILTLGFVDIDTKPGIYRITIKDSSETKTRFLRVLDKKFPVRNISLDSKKVFLNQQDEKRADEEEHILNSIWNTVTPFPLWAENFARPLNSSITSEFGVTRIINNKKESLHRGIDYKGSIGTPIKSINSGEIVLQDNHLYGGNTIVINHGLGLYSVYLHLSKIIVKSGDKVNKSQIIGMVGNTGRANGSHLHLSVKLYGESINPESLFNLDI